MKNRSRVCHELIHIVDLLPTIAHLVGFTVSRPIDGHNVWDTLSAADTTSPRQTVLGHYDQLIPYFSTIKGRWKLINGTTAANEYGGWLGETPSEERHLSMLNYGRSVLESKVGQLLSRYAALNENDIERLRQNSLISCRSSNGVGVPIASDEYCDPLKSACLFDLMTDPCERFNVAAEHPDIVHDLSEHIRQYILSAVSPRNKPGDIRSNPKNFNNTWTWWYDELGIKSD